MSAKMFSDAHGKPRAIDLMWELRKMLRDVLTLRREGSLQPRLGRAQGIVDGYMRALLDGGLATKLELLALVAEEREAAEGPAYVSLKMADSVA